jgi:DHA1 family bicyclomycin/chloramphenicol resistance-like MFS transporter
MVRFGFGAISAPLVGVAGAATVLPLGTVTTVCVVLAAAAFTGLAARPARDTATAGVASETAAA